MNKGVLLIAAFWMAGCLSAQETPPEDERFLEDQFYMGLTYNFLLGRPEGIAQQNLSYGLFAGIIRDIPLDHYRQWALGVGLGYGVNSYYSNLRAMETPEGPVYVAIDGDTEYKRNKIETHTVELPLELRWRNATPTEFKFWRVYAGFRIGYVFSGRSKFVGEGHKEAFSNDDLRKINYGFTLSAGYSTVNVHIYYSPLDLFKAHTLVDGDPIHMVPLRVGFIFYIL